MGGDRGENVDVVLQRKGFKGDTVMPPFWRTLNFAGDLVGILRAAVARFLLRDRDLLAALLLFCLSFLVLSPLACRSRCNHSWYFALGVGKERMREMVVRQQRVLGLRSDVYLSSLDPDRNMEFHRAHLNTGTMQLLVMVITARRKGENYLRRTMSALDQQLKQRAVADRDFRIGVLVCDTEDPEYPVWNGEEGGNSSTPFNSTTSTTPTSAAFGNTTWEELSERSYQIMRERFAFISLKAREEFKREYRGNYSTRAKEADDYYRCVALAHLSYRFEQLLVLEDDMELEDGGLKRLVRLASVAKQENNWDFIKVFYPARYQGFSISSLPHLSELLLLSSVAAAVVVWLLQSRKRMREKVWLHLKVTLLVAIQVCALGRQHTTGPIWRLIRPMSLVTAPGSCTSAILYPSSRLPFVLSRLSAERLTGANIDFVLRDLQAEEGEAEERRRAVGLMAENADYFRHIGYRSSLHSLLNLPRDFYLADLGLEAELAK